MEEEQNPRVTERKRNKREAKDIVELFFTEIRDSLVENEQVKLSGFGNFDLRDKRQRPGRNPKTGEEIPISARPITATIYYSPSYSFPSSHSSS